MSLEDDLRRGLPVALLAFVPLLLAQALDFAPAVVWIVFALMLAGFAVLWLRHRRKRGALATELDAGCALLAATVAVDDHDDVFTLFRRGDEWDERVRTALTGEQAMNWRHAGWNYGHPRLRTDDGHDNDDDLARSVVFPLWSKLRLLREFSKADG